MRSEFERRLYYSKPERMKRTIAQMHAKVSLAALAQRRRRSHERQTSQAELTRLALTRLETADHSDREALLLGIPRGGQQ